jgi:hypothetical protein
MLGLLLAITLAGGAVCIAFAALRVLARALWPHDTAFRGSPGASCHCWAIDPQGRFVIPGGKHQPGCPLSDEQTLRRIARMTEGDADA